mgnify:CR=1 FL=1
MSPDKMASSILDIVTTFSPVVILTALGHANAHPRCVQRLWLSEVDYSESDFLLLEGLRDIHREIEPLVMTSCVGVHSHVQIVCIRFWLDYHVKVAAFKHGVKNEFSFFVLQLGIHASERRGIIERVRQHHGRFQRELKLV